MTLLAVLSVPFWLLLARTLAVRATLGYPALTWRDGIPLAGCILVLSSIFVVLIGAEATRACLAFEAAGIVTLVTFQPLYRVRRGRAA